MVQVVADELFLPLSVIATRTLAFVHEHRQQRFVRLGAHTGRGSVIGESALDLLFETGRITESQRDAGLRWRMDWHYGGGEQRVTAKYGQRLGPSDLTPRQERAAKRFRVAALRLGKHFGVTYQAVVEDRFTETDAWLTTLRCGLRSLVTFYERLPAEPGEEEGE